MFASSRIRMCFRASLLTLPMLLAAACNEDGPEKGGVQAPVTFVFASHGDEDVMTLVTTHFTATTIDAAVIAQARAQLRLPPAQRSLHINGPIISATPPQNYHWRWRFIDDAWVLAEASMEVCDGAPHMVEEDLAGWLSLGRFCPWGSYVLGEVGAPVASGIIVKFSGSPSASEQQVRIGMVESVAAARDTELTYVREGALGAHVWRFAFNLPMEEAEDLAEAVSAQVPGIDYAEPDAIMEHTDE